METESGSRSVHAFIDKKTGEVYKPASFKAPAKHVRYNLLRRFLAKNVMLAAIGQVVTLHCMIMAKNK